MIPKFNIHILDMNLLTYNIKIDAYDFCKDELKCLRQIPGPIYGLRN